MLVVLKIPLVYLGIVVWWAIRAEPRPEDCGEDVGVREPLTPCTWGNGTRRSAAATWRPFRPLPRSPVHARPGAPA